MSGRAQLVSHALHEVARRAGLAFSDVRLAGAIETIEAWLTEHHITHPSQVTHGPGFDALLELLVIHESYFDRDLDQLHMIDELVFAPRGASAEPLRIWSAGCAGGEEPYTLAFMLQSRGLLAHAEILATDLSRAALHRAAAGVYRAWSLRTGAQTPAMRYLLQTGNELVVPPAIKRAIRFEPLNLVEDRAPVGQHLIVCRNVLIYLEPPAVAKVAANLARALAPDGWLFVAPSDPRLEQHAALVPTVTRHGIYYRRAEAERSVSAPAIARGSTRIAPLSRAPAVITPRPIAPAPPRAATSAVPASERAHQLADRGDYAGARRLLAEELARAPLDAELHFLAAVLAADEDVDASLASLDRAIYLAPDMPVSYLFAGRLYQSRGDKVGARRAYRTGLQVLAQLPPDAHVPWSDELPEVMAEACRQALEDLR